MYIYIHIRQHMISTSVWLALKTISGLFRAQSAQFWVEGLSQLIPSAQLEQHPWSNRNGEAITATGMRKKTCRNPRGPKMLVNNMVNHLYIYIYIHISSKPIPLSPLISINPKKGHPINPGICVECLPSFSTADLDFEEPSTVFGSIPAVETVMRGLMILALIRFFFGGRTSQNLHFSFKCKRARIQFNMIWHAAYIDTEFTYPYWCLIQIDLNCGWPATMGFKARTVAVKRRWFGCNTFWTTSINIHQHLWHSMTM